MNHVHVFVRAMCKYQCSWVEISLHGEQFNSNPVCLPKSDPFWSRQLLLTLHCQEVIPPLDSLSDGWSLGWMPFVGQMGFCGG